MKNYQFFLALSFTFAIISCGNKKTEVHQIGGARSYEIMPINNKIDTVNLTDFDGKKQGHWVVIKSIIPKSSILPTDNRKTLAGKIISRTLEEGYYKDDKKEGIWKYYNEEDGSLKDSVVYKNGEIVK